MSAKKLRIRLRKKKYYPYPEDQIPPRRTRPHRDQVLPLRDLYAWDRDLLTAQMFSSLVYHLERLEAKYKSLENSL